VNPLRAEGSGLSGKAGTMKVYVKAGLLSAFVLPGLGQICKGARLKGGVLIGLVNIFLLASLFLVMKGMGDLLVTARLSGMDAAEKVLDSLKVKGPAGRILLAAFLAIWAYGVFDALFREEGKPRE
jgi:hypothetical protein